MLTPKRAGREAFKKNFRHAELAAQNRIAGSRKASMLDDNCVLRKPPARIGLQAVRRQPARSLLIRGIRAYRGCHRDQRTIWAYILASIWLAKADEGAGMVMFLQCEDLSFPWRSHLIEFQRPPSMTAACAVLTWRRRGWVTGSSAPSWQIGGNSTVLALPPRSPGVERCRECAAATPG